MTGAERLSIATIPMAAALAAILFVVTNPETVVQTEPNKTVDPAGAATITDPTINTLLHEEVLRKQAANGDGDAAAKLVAAQTELDALRKRAHSGDADAALTLSGKLSWAGRQAEANDVLRIPEIRNDVDVQEMLMTSLSADIMGQIRSCRGVNQSLLHELIELLKSLAAKNYWLAERDLERFAAVADPTSPQEVMEKLFKSAAPPACDQRQ
jgi:hypothetical protein